MNWNQNLNWGIELDFLFSNEILYILLEKDLPYFSSPLDFHVVSGFIRRYFTQGID